LELVNLSAESHSRALCSVRNNQCRPCR
jgi:hypothetical protein